MWHSASEDKMAKNKDIQFIKPCRRTDEGHRELTPEYALECFMQGKVVQINLDNCSLQRMEMLQEDSTIKDVERVGLLPLAKILEVAPFISLTAMGVNEMPDKHVAKSMRAYQLFCKKFWPSHKDDKEATFRSFDESSIDRKVEFRKLPDGARCVYGTSYITMLQVQNIKLNHADKSPEEQFELYIYSMITMLDVLSAFDMEIAKYCFWSPTSNEINQLPESVQQRRRDIKKNFAKVGSELDKCKWLAFDAAMDIHWLCGSNYAEDLGVTLSIDGREFMIDNWVGTNDHKLFNICKDIHWVFSQGSNMKLLAVTREDELYGYPYWKFVDQKTEDIMKYRRAKGYNDMDNLLRRVDDSVAYIEGELNAYFNKVYIPAT